VGKHDSGTLIGHVGLGEQGGNVRVCQGIGSVTALQIPNHKKSAHL
jgi:hypothetical protein